MIILRPKAQFGNILFQYAFARMISLEFTNSPIYVDRTFGGKILIEMGLAKELIKPPAMYRVIFNQENFRDKLLSQVSKIHPNGFSRILQNGSSKIPIPPNVKSNFAVHGRFASSDYWNSHEQFIREEILLALQDLTNRNHSVLKNRLAVHVRRGDYMDDQHLKTIGALQLDYYIKAINTVVKKEGVSEIIVFTDDPNHPDIEALRSEFNCMVQSEDWSSDFFGIMNCEFQVISNSTFSWWAAFLSAGLDSKKVWAPDPFWIRGIHDDEDEIVPKGWNHLESIWYQK